MNLMEHGKGTLWIVATPIGTMDDMSPRARGILENVDLILAEDTRRTAKLLNHLKVRYSGKLVSYWVGNEKRRMEDILVLLRDGGSVALLSDAGTPVLSDPGFLLVRAARMEGLPVASLPGPSAFVAALAASGIPPLPAVLLGFLPPKRSSRQRKLAEFSGIAATLVMFLSPHRLAAEIGDVAGILGENRQAALLAELSKMHERVEYSRLGDLVSGREVGQPRGEYVLVVGPPVGERRGTKKPDLDEMYRVFDEALAETGEVRQARRLAARRLGISRKELYSILVSRPQGSRELC